MPQGQGLLQKAAELQERGWEVVRRLGLLERWSRVGRPVLVGSLRFGLMGHPNLDLEIYTETPQVADGFAVVSELAQVPGVVQVQYFNALDTADQGLYWRVDYQDERGDIWDIDNWLVAHDHPNAGLADGLATALEAKLSDEQRLAVLTIKNASDRANKARGVDIYKAVMTGGVTTPEEFERWRLANPPAEIELWQP
ncbi:MAG: phosphoglycerate mutase family protein [Proteobacteria bacterium]|nr:phosphoglycerate mutase family protein [Pseudomonadota bacterium]MBU4277270.1 phosphoglycerate mutase family protein [Pseudomonadota bacterium]MBU4384705.1 phosphoglycerate mutase family protein [Pseudomonadota bacterium]MBU4603874.1 phosphoglycerate mutase family protein [Pseudomonadota bacterium]MCG2764210.1 hypothetical protein [Desulfarculaceae bacterium]